MSYADYIPHRMLLNRSLRKASGELRDRVDEYQAEYERRVAEYEAKIETTEAGLKTEREIARAMLDRELDEVEAELQLFCDDIAAYVDCYLYHECLRKIRQIRKSQIAIYNEDDAFLSRQMRLIGDEIEILDARKSELSARVDVRDFIELSGLSGSPLILEDHNDCHSLLERIETALNEQADKYDPERYAFKRLKVIVQERAEHLHTIQYIDWIIRQKKLFSAQLSRKRAAIRESRGEAYASLTSLEKDIAVAGHELDELAERVRMRWVAPIVSISADICYAIQQKREVGGKLHSIASRHEYDPDWDDLESRRKRLEREIGRLTDERKTWYSRRSVVLGICSNNGAPLRSDGGKGKRDEIKLIKTRLDEIQAIRVEGAAEAEAQYESERQRITDERDERLQALNEELTCIEKHACDLEAQERGTLNEISAATHNLRAAEAADRRFILFRIVPTEEIASARSALRQAKSRHAGVAANLATAKARLSEKQAEVSEASSQFERSLRKCRPRYLRPTSEELLEEKKLQLLLQELEGGRRREVRR